MINPGQLTPEQIANGDQTIAAVSHVADKLVKLLAPPDEVDQATAVVALAQYAIAPAVIHLYEVAGGDEDDLVSPALTLAAELLRRLLITQPTEVLDAGGGL